MDAIDANGLLRSDILISHACNLTPSDEEKLTKAHASVSSTPDTELQMGLGHPVCFRDGVKAISSLGIDCHSNNSGDIISQMRLILQAERGRRNEILIQQGKAPRSIDPSVQDVFQLGTMGGARAINMQDRLGSLQVGKLADIVIFDALSPGLICAAEQDPVSAIVLHSSVADIDGVIVDGHFRKRDAKLIPVDLDLSGTKMKLNATRVGWRDVAAELLNSRERIDKADKKSLGSDPKQALNDVIGMFYIDEENLA